MTTTYRGTANLEPGENHIMFDVPGMSVETITLKANCNAQLKRFFHGQQNFLCDPEPIDLSKLPPDGWYLHADPAEQFHDGVQTTLVVEASAPGELTVLFCEKAS